HDGDALATPAHPLEMPAPLRARVLRQRSSFGRADAVELVRGLAQVRLEGANAEAGEDRLHAVDEQRPLADQRLSLAARSSHVLLGNRRDRRHAAMALLPPQPPEKGAHQQLRAEAIGLGTPVLTRTRDARGMDDIGFELARPQPPRQPAAVA